MCKEHYDSLKYLLEEKDKVCSLDKETLYELLDDLRQDCYNDCYEYNDGGELGITDEQADLIYHNVELFILKLKDRIEDEGYFDKN